MEIKKLINTLDALERKILPLLKTEKDFSSLVQKSKLQEVEVMRALQWLKNKNILQIHTQKKKFVFLDKNGQKYLTEGLPEKKVLQIIQKKPLTISQIKKQINLSDEELKAALGQLKKKVALEFIKEKETSIKITDPGQKILSQESLEEKFLKKKFPLEIDQLQDEDKFAFDELKKRKNILKIEDQTQRHVELTELGQQLTQQKIEEKEVINRLTSSMLKNNTWQKKSFRAYDLQADVPKIYPGKKHFVTEATEYAKKIWLEMGFQEMTGPLVNTSFWNFDVLFTAQDHPVRELQDTFYLENPATGKLPNQELVKEVQEMHQHGGNISKGWQYSWNPEEAKKNVLRTHTTVLSALTLAKLKEKKIQKGKYFALGKCFRNEALDWSHLFEFNQTEGIVIDPHANFRHLLGYLKEFFKKMGFPKARFRPAFFPYTEPSVEIDVYHPVHKKWIELGGAGMFRPEVVVPLLGEDIPVLAWGPGFDRLILDYYQISDIRELYKNDLKQLRGVKKWME